MLVNTKDLVRTFQGNGEAFEEFAHDLVRAVGRSCGIDPVQVHWDHRTSAKDGGRDLVVGEPNPAGPPKDRKALRSTLGRRKTPAGFSTRRQSP